MKMAIRGGQLFDPSPQLEPRRPFLRDDRDDVREARPAGDATFLDEDQAQQAGLAHRVLDGGAGAARERRNRVDVQGADPGALTLAANDRQDRQFGQREA
jgi:hypothetical protein